jgi:site-specific DNA recombinase
VPRTDLAEPEQRRYLLAGLLACGDCGRRMESAWSNCKPAYRCRHGHTSAAPPDPARPKNAYVREDRILAQLPALHLLLTGQEPARRRRTRRGADTRPQASPETVITYLRDREITTYCPAEGILQTGTAKAKTTIRKASCPQGANSTRRKEEKKPPVARHRRKPVPG